MAAPEDSSVYIASWDKPQMMSGDDSSEDSVPSMLDAQSTDASVTSAGKHFTLRPLTHGYHVDISPYNREALP